MGHCSSYDELKAVDTGLAMEVLAKAEEYGTVVPSNISSGSKVYGPEPPPTVIADHTKRRRSLPESGSVYELLECSAHGRRPAVTHSIGYCPMIEGPSTDFSTVYTVLKHAQKISASVGQAEAVITFDLAIYTKAMQIQMRFPDEFSNTVIRLGGFHVALNFLSLLGKKFMNSGLDDLLIESGVYAAGTTSALMKGKSYNRGVRAHKLSMEVLYRLMWSAFAQWCGNLEREDEQVDHESLNSKLEACRQAIESKVGMVQSVKELERDMMKIASLFEKFKAEAVSQSMTFSFWEQYISMVKLLLQFIKAERTGNWSLHLSSTAAMIPHFFAMDRPNYARWLPVYISDMKQLQVKHPRVHQEFATGNHAVSRSGQPFSQRWFLTCHERAFVTTALKEAYSVHDSDRVGIHKEASPKRLARDEDDVQKLVNCFTSGMMTSPFTHDSDALVNFATGVVLPTEVANSLVNCTEKGNEQMSAFIEKRLDSNDVNFWDPISNLKIKTFDTVSKRIQIDLKEVLGYELSSIPYALAHPDGSLRKTNKSALAAIMETNINVCPVLPISTRDTIHLMDAMALVQAVKSGGSNTFGALVQKYYSIIVAPLQVASCNEVHLVFDQYWDVSIKAGERSRRGSTATGLEVQISGPAIPVPKQWGKFMSNQRNKINLCDFLTSSLCELGQQHLPANKKLVIGGGYKDGIRAVCVTNGRCEDVMTLKSDHEEADTRLFLHAKHAVDDHPSCRIVIQSPDTDVFLLGVTHFVSLGCEELWLKTGVKDRLRFIPLHDVARTLGDRMCKALPAFHAISGCDSTSALSGIGKKKAWVALKSSEVHQESLGLVGTGGSLCEVTMKKCEAYVCNLYPCNRRATTADELRYLLFCQKKQKNEMLPPTSDSLHHHLKRANYQAMVWRRSLEAIQELPSPEDNGWERAGNNELKPVLMTKDPAPSSLLELTTYTVRYVIELAFAFQDVQETRETARYLYINQRTSATICRI
ncbi:hypothetical protein QZH41_001193 [Actinostola sp. cb2023]|nr:hypothetical protein QZH41_001193 [Actinostola sp. cb2023]